MSSDPDAPPPLRLVAILKHRVVADRTFAQDRITIGRAPGCDLHLDNMALSRVHAEVIRGAWGWLLRDRGSRNGLHVNGQPAQQHRLQDGDRIGLGKFLITCSLPEPRRELPAEGRPDGRTQPVDPAAEPRVPEAHLLLTDASRRAVPLLRDAIHVGGHPRCAIRLPGLFTPRCLAAIVRGAGGYTLLNVGPGGDRVYHNGRPVALRVALSDGDRLELGPVRARFKLGPPRRRGA